MTKPFERHTSTAFERKRDIRPGSRKGRIIILVLAAIAFLVAANGHFIYVAVTTQPDCVAHQKTIAAGSFRAAKSSC